MPEIEYKNLPFDEAIAYLRDKVDLGTQKWTDIWQEMHNRSFVVAGAMEEDLLADLHSAVNQAIADGTTIADFRKAFDETVQKNGWSYKGSRGWRTGIIFNTNLRVAYAKGHYDQMQAVKEDRPYWRYSAVLDGRTRPLHRQWHNTILPADDPWWDTHYPPNGWGCRCTVVSVSSSEMARDKQTLSKRPDNGTYEWVNKDTGVIETVPNGIDAGWAYNPGKTGWKD